MIVIGGRAGVRVSNLRPTTPAVTATTPALAIPRNRLRERSAARPSVGSQFGAPATGASGARRIPLPGSPPRSRQTPLPARCGRRRSRVHRRARTPRERATGGYGPAFRRAIRRFPRQPLCRLPAPPCRQYRRWQWRSPRPGRCSFDDRTADRRQRRRDPGEKASEQLPTPIAMLAPSSPAIPTVVLGSWAAQRRRPLHRSPVASPDATQDQAIGRHRHRGVATQPHREGLLGPIDTFGFQMFPESSQWRADVYRILADGAHRRSGILARGLPLGGTRVRPRPREPPPHSTMRMPDSMPRSGCSMRHSTGSPRTRPMTEKPSDSSPGSHSYTTAESPPL